MQLQFLAPVEFFFKQLNGLQFLTRVELFLLTVFPAWFVTSVFQTVFFS